MSVQAAEPARVSADELLRRPEAQARLVDDGLLRFKAKRGGPAYVNLTSSVREVAKEHDLDPQLIWEYVSLAVSFGLARRGRQNPDPMDAVAGMLA